LSMPKVIGRPTTRMVGLDENSKDWIILFIFFMLVLWW